MFTFISRVVVSAALVGSATAVVATVAGSSPVRTHLAASVTACTGAGTDVWFDTQGNGAAGTSYYNVEFTNLSGHSCTLYGYPGVSAVNLAGTQIGAPATRSAGTAHTVTLAAGATVKALLGVVDTGDFSKSACQPVEAAGFRIYAPGSTVSRIVWYPSSVCSKSTEPSLHVSPVA